MAWTDVQWACGHSGQIQLYGKHAYREATVAKEAGRQCMACWLVGRWEAENDPRAQREDRYQLAADIAKNKGKRINVPDSVPVKNERSSLEAERARLIARIAEIDAILNS